MGTQVETYPTPNGWLRSFTKVWHSTPYEQISPFRTELSAAGKVVLITGGGTGIGKATAIAFAQADARGIAIFGRRIDKLKAAAQEIRDASPSSTQVTFESVDLTRPKDVDQAFTNAINTLGGGAVDIFINNAAVSPQIGPIDGYNHEEFVSGFQANVGSAFNSIVTILPKLATNANVINISSGAAHVSPMKGMWLYSTTKAATTKMFDFLQSENPNLHVINFQPGIVASELNAKTGYAGEDEVELPGQFQVWLTSPEAEFLKGQFVWANWDVDELKARADEIRGSMLLKVGLYGVPM